MKVQYASDIHLEFSENRDFLMRNPMIPIGDVLVIAGDSIYLNNSSHFQFEFWDWVSENFKQTLVIPGNHEFYHEGDLFTYSQEQIISVRDNISIHYNSIVVIDDVEFLLTPLWSHITPALSEITRRSVSDFHQILYKGTPLSVDDFNEEHRRCLDFLRNALNEPTPNKRIVVSHHVPSMSCTAVEFLGSSINGAFTVNMDDFINEHPVDYRIYGHSHRNLPPVRIGRTTLLTNQLGYVMGREHKAFRPDAVIKI